MPRNTKFQLQTLDEQRSKPSIRVVLSDYVLRLVLVLALAVAGQPAIAQLPGWELLNSERIEQTFGSYAVEVVADDGRTRVTNLYSTDGGTRTCRTFAVVRFPERIDPELVVEHAAIKAGGSIGAVLATHGWRVLKTHLAYREFDATPRLAALMHIPNGTHLAADTYVLDVSKEGRTLQYAALVEIHHPAYLSLGDLPRIYGSAEVGSRRSLLDDLLAAAAKAAE